MKKTIIALAVFAGATLSMNAQKAITPEFKTPADSIGYSFGYSFGKNVKAQGIEASDINLYNFFIGMQAALKNDQPVLPDAEIESNMMKFQMAMQQKAMVAKEKAASVNKADGIKYMETYKKQDGVKSTASGLLYKVISKGKGGAAPKATDKVKVHYTGKLINGKVFDSSVQRGEPIEFPLNGVIKGWTEGLQLMQVGDKFEFVIPSELAYGERGAGADIGPGATLIFEVELLDIPVGENK